MTAIDLKGESPLKACGKTWKLVLPFRQAKALKAEHGIDLLSDGLSMAEVDKFDLVLEAMLKTAHPDITSDEVCSILDDVGIKPVMEAMRPALAAFMGVTTKQLEDAEKAATGAGPQ